MKRITVSPDKGAKVLHIEAEILPYDNNNAGIPILRKSVTKEPSTRVCILAKNTNLPDGRSVIGMYKDSEGFDRLITFREDGTFLPSGKKSDLDLVLANIII